MAPMNGSHVTRHRPAVGRRSCRFVRVVCCAAVLSSLGLGDASAQGGLSRLTGFKPSRKVAIVYDDQKLSDSARAKLVTIVSDSVPRSQWRTVTVESETDLRSLVNRYFDYFDRGRYSAPRTVAAAIAVIQRANGLQTETVAAGTELALPPLPVRANGRFDARGVSRVFNANDSRQAVETSKEVVKLPTASATAAPAVDASSTERGTAATSIVVEMTKENEGQLAAKSMPPGVVTFSALENTTNPAAPQIAIGSVQVELLDAPATQCGDPFALLERSPLRSKQQALVRRHFLENEARLLELAERTPLVILDVGFASHHGAKVREVVKQVLDRLGASSLLSKVREVELYPVDARAKANLLDALETHAAPRRGMGNGFDDKAAEARRWIETASSMPAFIGPRLDMPELVLRAVFEKYVPSSAFLNMSFRLQSQQTSEFLSDLARTAPSFSVAGVGNVVEAIDSGWTPQDIAMDRPNFVTVTYGTELGELFAQFGGDTGSRVLLLAPGCGFPGIAEKGSSLASPYVAAAAWLRFLFDELESGERPSTIGLWRDLIAAAHPLPALKHPVESGGMFDPAMLLAGRQPRHSLLGRDGNVVPLRKFELVVTCNDPADKRLRFKRTIRRPLGEGAEAHIDTFALGRAGAADAFWHRQVVERGYVKVQPLPPCNNVHSVKFSAITATGKKLSFSKAKTFAENVALLTW
jgi:hypothetical protein